MKNKCLYTTIIFFHLFLFSLAQPLPTGLRLKDIPSSTLIGSMISYGYGTTDPYSIIIGQNTSEISTIVAREFNIGTATCYPKWEGWVTQGQYDCNKFNTVVNWLTDRNKTPIMHMFAGPNIYFPDWFINGNWSAAQQDSLLKSWIYFVMESNDNKNKVKVWNIVNEALDYNGVYIPNSSCKWHDMGFENDASGLTGASKINNQHPIYIRKAFQYAAEKTDNILELRDNAIEFNSPKSDGFYQLVKHLLNTGVRVDAVGLQCHFDLNEVTNKLNEFKQQILRYKNLGLKVYLTEVDIANTVPLFDAVKAQQQKNDFYNLTKASIETGVQGINLWGFRDENPFWRTNENATPFYANFTAKPAYYGIQKALLDNPPQVADTIANGTYMLTAKHSGKALDVQYSSNQNGARVWQYTPNNSSAQQWQITHLGSGFYKLIATCSGKALDVVGISLNDGALLQQWDFGNGNNQIWKIESTGNGFYKLIAKHSGKALDVLNALTTDEALVQQYSYYGNDNQLWKLDRFATNKIQLSTESKNDFSINPNPTFGNTQIIYNSANATQKIILSIADENGKVFYTSQVNAFEGRNTYLVDVKKFPPAIYIVSIKDDSSKNVTSKKMIVK